jgi:hypothetical protein
MYSYAYRKKHLEKMPDQPEKKLTTDLGASHKFDAVNHCTPSLPPLPSTPKLAVNIEQHKQQHQTIAP